MSTIINQVIFETPLGSMIAVADQDALYILEFLDRKRLESEMVRLKQRTQSTILSGTTEPLIAIQKELKQYFAGTLSAFKTPFVLQGSPFQQAAWHALCQIPYGETRSYLDQATHIGRPSAYRAVANANGANQLAIIVPCHRIINHNGRLGGYGGGLARKEWLLKLEKTHAK